jgi:hypothetical protein
MDTKGKSNTSRGVAIRKILIANKDIQQMISMNNDTTNYLRWHCNNQQSMQRSIGMEN